MHVGAYSGTHMKMESEYDIEHKYVLGTLAYYTKNSYGSAKVRHLILPPLFSWRQYAFEAAHLKSCKAALRYPVFAQRPLIVPLMRISKAVRGIVPQLP